MKHSPKVAVVLGLLAGVMAGLSGSAQADRFLVQIGDMKPVYCADAQTYLSSFETQTGMRAPTPAMLAAIPAVGAQPNPAVAVTPEAAALANLAVTEPAQRVQGMHANMSEVIQPQSGPPDAAFLAQLSSIYSITVQAEIQQVWEWYLKEPAALPLSAKVGNGVVRFVMAANRPPTGDTSANPATLKPEATSGRVRASNGVSVRSAPWQPSSGNSLGSGAAVTLVPPANGPWYQLQGGGWVCGLWLDFN